MVGFLWELDVLSGASVDGKSVCLKPFSCECHEGMSATAPPQYLAVFWVCTLGAAVQHLPACKREGRFPSASCPGLPLTTLQKPAPSPAIAAGSSSAVKYFYLTKILVFILWEGSVSLQSALLFIEAE